MGKVSRAEQAGRRLAESINESANLMYQSKTKKNFFKGLISQLDSSSPCHTCPKKYWCAGYNKDTIRCDEYIDQVTVI